MTALQAAAAFQQSATRPQPMPRIDTATAADANSLSAVYARAFDGAFNTVSREFSRMVAGGNKPALAVQAALEDRNATVMVLRVGADIAGFAIARAGRLDAIGVVPEHRGQGFGGLLFRNMARAVPHLRVRAATANGFFTRMGGEGAVLPAGTMIEVGGMGFAGFGAVVREYGSRPHPA